MLSFETNNQLLNSLMYIIFLLPSCHHLLSELILLFLTNSDAGSEQTPSNSFNFKTTLCNFTLFLHLFQLFHAIFPQLF